MRPQRGRQAPGTLSAGSSVVAACPRRMEPSRSKGREQPRRQRVSRSCCRGVLLEHGCDLPPAVDFAQPDLSACHETEKEDNGRIFARQRALRFYAAPKFPVEPFNRVRGSQRLPLSSGEGEECEQLLAAFLQARHHPLAAFGPRALEGCKRRTSGIGTGRVDDRMSASACFGALRSRLRSLWTQQRCTAVRGHTSPTARRSSAFPSMMHNTGIEDRAPRDHRGSPSRPQKTRWCTAPAPEGAFDHRRGRRRCRGPARRSPFRHCEHAE
jgi:hypothetical protein